MSDRQRPLNYAPGLSDHSDLRSDANGRAPRVVVVDDDPGIQLLLRETLAGAGFNVAVAASGAEAIDVCAAFEPDLLLLDINMPAMDGITACARIRQTIDRDFPIVMVTSVDDAVSIQRAFDAGASDFILKPINWPIFQRRLNVLLAEWQKSRELDESEKRVDLLVKIAPEHAMLVSRSGLIIEDLKHRPDSMDTGRKPAKRMLDDVFGAEVAQRFKQRISGVLKTQGHNNLEFSLNEHGLTRHLEAQFLVDGRDRVIVVVQNVSIDKNAQEAMFELAYVDAVSELPNRNFFDRFAEQALVDAGLHGHRLIFANLSFDNASGDDLGDEDVMRSVSNHIRACLKDHGGVLTIGDGKNPARIARLESNRFAFLVHSTENESDVGSVCDRIAARFSEAIETRSGPITFSPRLGAATYPVDGRDLQSVMHAAEAALHESRLTGKTLCFSSQAVTEQSISLQDYGMELRQAMDDGQLELYFQPRRSMPDGTVTCVEALLRWNHPMRGFVGVSELLHLAKATGLIVPLGNWVLLTACTEARRWLSDAAPRVSINLSQQEFIREDLVERVIDVIGKSGLDPGRIELEFTEDALLSAGNVIAELEKLKRTGIKLSLDNFGTGHTSLGHLKKLPVDVLKIDGSLVRGLPSDAGDAAICEVIITLAHKLGMKSVAEGVETQEQMDFLMHLGCDEFQGFHICRPLPADEIGDLLQLSTPDAR